MTAGTSFLHVTASPGAADVVRAGLERLGRNELVVAMRDDYAEGPLRDADGGAKARADWWRELRGSLDPGETFDDADLWAQVFDAHEDIVLWHGPHAMERIFALRACFHLRDYSERVHEVALARSDAAWRNRPRPAFYDAVALIGPVGAAAAWPPRKVVDLEHRAALWEELRDREGEWIRVLDEDERLLHLPVTAYDPALAGACRNGDWTRTRIVVGSVLGDHGSSDALLWWRIRELLREGRLEGRGVDREFEVPDEVRPATAASQDHRSGRRLTQA